MAPNIPIPTRKTAAMDTEKIWLVNRENGRIGSAAWVSAKAKATRLIRAAAKRPRMTGELHGYWAPPQISAKRSETRPAVKSTAPA